MKSIMETVIEEAYSQEGGNLPFFVGNQHGSGWLRTLARFAFPLLKGAAKVVSNTAEDVIYDNKKLLPALQENAIKAVSKVIANPSTINRPQKRRHEYFEVNNPKNNKRGKQG